MRLVWRAPMSIEAQNSAAVAALATSNNCLGKADDGQEAEAHWKAFSRLSY